MYFHQSLWCSERSRGLKYNHTKTCKGDIYIYIYIAFPYKEAITNAYGLIDLTTARVNSRSLPSAHILEEKVQRKKPKTNNPYLMVKQVLQAVHFDKPFNQIAEEAAEWNNVKENKQIRREGKTTYQALHYARPMSMMMQDYYSYRSIYI